MKTVKMKTAKVFYCYAQEDATFRQELEKHLGGLRRSMLITTWYDRQIHAGMDWRQEIDSHLESADIILLLVSTAFFRSDYCYGAEMKRALERHKIGDAYVIPVLTHPVDWEASPLKDLEVLPTGGTPIGTWANRDGAWLNVTEGIRRIVTKISGSLPPEDTSLAPKYNRSSAGIQEMADRLEMRKKNNHHTVLLLGTRAGRLFHSTHVYESLQKLSSRNFHQLSRIRQFQECYTLLTSGKFSETDLHSILHTSLKDLHVSEADACLASLIKQEYFDEILSTNIDDILEEALLQIDLKEGRDYDVTRIGRSVPYYKKSHPYRIIKLFGDFVSRDYTIRERSAHFEEQGRKNFLQNLLEKDLLLVGIDLAWDQDILRLIPLKASGTVWFVSEEDDVVDKSSFLADILRARHATHILGQEGSYDHFIRKVHHCLLGNVPYAHAQALEHIQQRIDQIARIIEILPAITEQLTSPNARLAGVDEIYSQIQMVNNENKRILEEIQKVQKELGNIEKDRFLDT